MFDVRYEMGILSVKHIISPYNWWPVWKTEIFAVFMADKIMCKLLSNKKASCCGIGTNDKLLSVNSHNTWIYY
jgi:hypothetical protein